jgi:cellulose synthase/poly-beta-1,6-N-acetylglucosamine synthase-like glycosyltransferase
MEILLISVYSVCMLFVLAFSMVQLHLALTYRKAKKHSVQDHKDDPGKTDFPLVTVQLPVYNEKYVVERLLNSVAMLDWPAASLQVQVLDDSADF